MRRNCNPRHPIRQLPPHDPPQQRQPHHDHGLQSFRSSPTPPSRPSPKPSTPQATSPDQAAPSPPTSSTLKLSEPSKASRASATSRAATLPFSSVPTLAMLTSIRCLKSSLRTPRLCFTSTSLRFLKMFGWGCATQKSPSARGPSRRCGRV